MQCPGSDIDDNNMILEVRQVTSASDPAINPDALVDLVNRAYTDVEQGLVRPSPSGRVLRLTSQSAREQLDRGEFLVLLGRQKALSTTKRQPVLLGCCTVLKLEDCNIGEWGCLAVHPDYQGRRYGRRLLETAESHLSDIRGCRTLQLKFLGFAKPVPDTRFAYEHKHRLMKWYTEKLGYHSVPDEAVYYAANAPFGNFEDTYFESDAVLMPFRKPVDTWIELAAATESSHMEALVEFCNQVYQEGEAAILQHTPENPIIRLLVSDAMELIERQELLVLWERTSNETKQPIGCIKATVVSEKVGEWGCLAVHPKYQHRGLARRLVRAAEYHLQHKHGCTRLQLQLLTPVHWTQMHKERLRSWYQGRLDYQPNGHDAREYKRKGETTGPLVFATDAVFTTYTKSLKERS